MRILQGVQQCTRAPSLGGTRIVAERAVLVRQLRQTSPGILSDVCARREEGIMHMVQ